MSTINSVTLDSLVSVKVAYEGNVRRFKLALKDVGPSMFQDKLRELLGIPVTQDVKFERYSDSAGHHVTLDPENTAVYKQLFRAAKAKLKLRIRVTALSTQSQGDSSSVNGQPTASAITPSSIDVTCSSAAVDSVELEKVVFKAVTNYCSGSEFATHLRDTVREEVEKKIEGSKPSSVLDLSDSPQSADLKSFTGLRSVSIPRVANFTQSTSAKLPLAIFCDSCNVEIHEEHYHCPDCNGGDFDLCQNCFSHGKECNGSEHTMVKRNVVGGKISETVPSKQVYSSRICNCCVEEFSDLQCVACKNCKDYDLCLPCLRSGQHGHDPRHEFVPTHESTELSPKEKPLLMCGRNTKHAALCDGCDKPICGLRYKCIDCPDWDYCNLCIGASRQTHPGHRFVSVLDKLSFWPQDSYNLFANVYHYGVFCDGPICRKAREERCIQGVRYKCAICPDTDFCATCEASPLNKHNHTHPLIKLKIPIRNVLVTTTDDKEIIMGDQTTTTTAQSTSISPNTVNTATQVQTFVDVKPSEDYFPPTDYELEGFEEYSPPADAEQPQRLRATFEKDDIRDGSVLNPGQCFTQSWFMKNSGKSSWPAGVTVKFVGGTYMFIKSEEDVLNATVTDREVQPGEVAKFSVDLIATYPAGLNYTSYWRLTGPDGERFGDLIWCSINVEPEPVKHEESKEQVDEELKEQGQREGEIGEDGHYETCSLKSTADTESIKGERDGFESAPEDLVKSQTSSEMVFPKLTVETPVHTFDHSTSTSIASSGIAVPASPSSSSHKTFALSEDGDFEEEVEISSLDGFLTDEEYDVLDASDEEYERVA